MSKVEKALAYHRQGYNCAQAVACAFAEELGMDERELFRVTEAFGFGMGTMGTCGAVSGMAAVAGLAQSDGDLAHPGSKRQTYGAMKQMTEAFRTKNQSVICRELKGVDTGTVLRSCDGCIEDAVRIAEAWLASVKKPEKDR